jgi:putative oxidoreductase
MTGARTTVIHGPGQLIQSLVVLFEHIPHSAIALLARIVIGLVFLKSGLTKVDGFHVTDSALFLFQEEYKVPLLSPWLAAHLAAFAELTMPVLLFAGLGARFAALVLLGMTIVIQVFVYPEAYVTHGLWAVALLLIVARGAGRLSLDHFVSSRWRAAGS